MQQQELEAPISAPLKSDTGKQPEAQRRNTSSETTAPEMLDEAIELPSYEAAPSMPLKPDIYRQPESSEPQYTTVASDEVTTPEPLKPDISAQPIATALLSTNVDSDSESALQMPDAALAPVACEIAALETSSDIGPVDLARDDKKLPEPQSNNATADTTPETPDEVTDPVGDEVAKLTALSDDDFTDLARDYEERALLRANTAQGCLYFRNVLPDGISHDGDCVFSRLVAFDDVNYLYNREHDQAYIYNTLIALYNGFMPGTRFKVHIINEPVTRGELFEEFKAPDQDQADMQVFADEDNARLQTALSETQHNVKRYRYLTIAVTAYTLEEARPLLAQAVRLASEKLELIRANPRVLDGVERLKVMLKYTAPGEVPEDYNFTMADLAGLDAKDYLAPIGGYDFYPGGDKRIFMAGDKYAQALYWPNKGGLPRRPKDTILSDIFNLDIPMAATLTFTAIDNTEATAELYSKLRNMDSRIGKNMQDYSTHGVLPSMAVTPFMQNRIKQVNEQIDAMEQKDQNLFLGTLLLCIYGDTLEELNTNRFTLQAKTHQSRQNIAPLSGQQLQAFNTMLPTGNDMVELNRAFLSYEAAIFMPFTNTKVQEPGGIFYGRVKETGDLITYDRRNSNNRSEMVFGKPGFGKTFGVDVEVSGVLMRQPRARVYILDTKNHEFNPLVERWGGTIWHGTADSTEHINPFDIPSYYQVAGRDPITSRTADLIYILSTVAARPGETLSNAQQGIISRAIKACYDQLKKENYGVAEAMPTLLEFYENVRRDPSSKALDLADDFSIFAEGALDVFAHHTNVDLSARLIDFDISELDPSLKVFGMLVVLMQIWNLLLYNQAHGYETYVYIDEFHKVGDSPTALEYARKFWFEGRSFGLIPCGITQNAAHLLEHPILKHILSDSASVIMYQQADLDLFGDKDTEGLVTRLHLSETDANLLLAAPQGVAVAKFNDVIVHINNTFSDEEKNSETYKLFSTDPGEREAAARAAEREAAAIAAGIRA
ncbi:MAG: hypothetical protein FWF45_00655 [Coriobacteriia bacterium]|nr:hypothetical protein [Coriobacteriia bacterium]